MKHPRLEEMKFFAVLFILIGFILHVSHPAFAQDQVTQAEMDKFRNQIAKCYASAIRLSEDHDKMMPILIRLSIHPDRTLSAFYIPDEERLSTDPRFNFTVKIIEKLFNNPECHILNLPAEKYNHWKTASLFLDSAVFLNSSNVISKWPE